MRHVVLQFPGATSAKDLGSRYILKFARHFEDDEWHGRYNQVIIREGPVAQSPGVQAVKLSLGQCNVTVHDWSTIVPPAEVTTDLLQPLVADKQAADMIAHKQPEEDTKPLIATEACNQDMLAEGSLEWDAPVSCGSDLVDPILRLGMARFSLCATSVEALAAEEAGTYTSGSAARWLRRGLLSKI